MWLPSGESSRLGVHLYQQSCREQELTHAGAAAEGGFDLVPFIKILPEEELFLCDCSRPEKNMQNGGDDLYEEAILFTRPVRKMSSWAQLK